MTEIKYDSETHEIRLRRLRMRSWRRGMKEMDLILGGFADTELAKLTGPELDAHEALMDENDQEIYSWITGAVPAPVGFKPAIEKILENLSPRS